MFTLPDWRDALTWNSSSGNTKLECVSCMETYATKKCVVAPCSHVYCSKCMVSLIETCLRDERIFPVKCCKQVIPTSKFMKILHSSLRSRYEYKALEFSTSADWRIYCSNRSCSAFLGSSGGETKTMACTKCRTSTCSGCKQAAHPGDTCRGNLDATKLRQMAKKERWQTCPGCNAIVEQKAGCNHMTCRCRTEFCYLCGVKWKKCSCPQFGDPGRTAQEPAPEYEVFEEADGAAEQDEEVNQLPIVDEDMPIINFQDLFADQPFFGRYPDDPPTPFYESSEDEGPYINPYDYEPFQQEQGEYDEGLDFDSDDRAQDLLNMFLPPTDPDDDSEDIGPYINPYDPESSSNAANLSSTMTAEPDNEDSYAQGYDASDEEDFHAHPMLSYDFSDDDDDEVYINPYGSVPDLSRLHVDDLSILSDDEGPYINPYDPAPTPPDTCPRVTYDSNNSDEEEYINPYDIDPKTDKPSFYCDGSDDSGPYINPYGSNSGLSLS